MPLSTQMMYCAARIVGDIPIANEDGSRRGTIGTGFCLSIASSNIPGRRHRYLLTADHVVDGQENIEAVFADPFNEGKLLPPLKFEANDWKAHNETDLAIASLHKSPGGKKPMDLGLEYMLPIEQASLSLGSKIYYIGLLDPLDRPMVRSGTMGALDQKGIEHIDGYVYDAHLVDCRSYEGFSGSPCFAEFRFAGLTPTQLPFRLPDGYQGEPIGSVFSLNLPCGMFTEHLHDTNHEGTASRYGVGIMLRGNEIREALMTDELKAERREWEPHLQAASVRRPASGEFDRFEELTRSLVQVPKSDIDKQRKS